MPKLDIEAAIRALVSDTVRAKLEPYTEILDRLAAFVGDAPRRGLGRPPKADAGGRRANVRGFAKKAVKAAKRLKVGQMVSYRQGRGSFDATIVAIDLETGIVRIERAKDGKKVERPAHKLGGVATPSAMDVVEEPSADADMDTNVAKKKAARRKRGRKAASKAKKPKADAGPRPVTIVSEGQTVLYRQGRGAFKAVVTAIDHVTGTVLLKRDVDGKEVLRPADKLQLTDA
jgi:sRNA-binding protein